MLRILTLALILTAFSFGAEAKFSAEQKTEIETIISEYLKENPEVITTALDSMQQKRIEEEQKAMRKATSKYRKELERNKLDPIIGNPKGDVVLVEFFDYNCGYCKVMFPEILSFVEKDGKVKWVLKELPMLSPSSRYASKAALAANKQGKYKEVHSAFMEHKGALNEEDVLKIAKEKGLDIEKLKKDMESKEIEDMLNSNQELAGKLNMRGIPNFIMNTFINAGGFDTSVLPEQAKKIRDAKAKAKAKKAEKKAKADKAAKDSSTQSDKKADAKAEK